MADSRSFKFDKVEIFQGRGDLGRAGAAILQGSTLTLARWPEASENH